MIPSLDPRIQQAITEIRSAFAVDVPPYEHREKLRQILSALVKEVDADRDRWKDIAEGREGKCA